ncbi:MAG: FGGY family carbohydrate kinase [Candidatus Heimdallarchaeaceae archaeon]
MNYRMVFDAGSKALKCAIADENSKILAIESFLPEVIQSEDGFGRNWEHTKYWDNLLNLAKKTIKVSKINSEEIKYITSSIIRPSCVFTEEDFEPLYIGSSFDVQGIDYGDEIDERLEELTGKDLYQHSGHFPNFLMIPSRLEFLNNNPEKIDYKKISHYVPLDSWILVKFGGEFHTNYTSAFESGFFSVKEKMWLDEWHSIFNIEDEFFPPPVFSGEVIGNVSSEIQEQLNLNSEVELVAGIPDTQAALLASNSITPGCISVVLGSTTPVQAVTESLCIDEEERTWTTGIHVKNLCDNYIVEANTGLTGQVVKWAAHLFDTKMKTEFLEPTPKQYNNLNDKLQNFDEFEQNESEENIVSHSVYANLGPSTLRSSDRAAGEFYFPSPGGVEEFFIHQNQLVGAVFDNIMYAVSRNIDLAREVAKFDEFSLTILGGLSRYKILSQRFSDLYSQPIQYLRNYEASIEGLLVLCDIASGKVNNMSDYQQRITSKENLMSLDPRSSMTTKLEEKYKKWMSITKI